MLKLRQKYDDNTFFFQSEVKLAFILEFRYAIMPVIDKDHDRYDLKRLCCLEKKMGKQRLRCGDNAAMKLL